MQLPCCPSWLSRRHRRPAAAPQCRYASIHAGNSSDAQGFGRCIAHLCNCIKLHGGSSMMR
jgi:hypothetical protein